MPPNWVVKLANSLSPVQTMIMGTAGFTALYGIHRLQVENVHPDSGPVLVTGATGGSVHLLFMHFLNSVTTLLLHQEKKTLEIFSFL